MKKTSIVLAWRKILVMGNFKEKYVLICSLPTTLSTKEILLLFNFSVLKLILKSYSILLIPHCATCHKCLLIQHSLNNIHS